MLAEGDALVLGLPAENRAGFAAMLQSDAEPVQGVHLINTFEALKTGVSGESTGWSGWFSVAWFFLPHVDLRLDAIGQRFPSSNGPASTVQSYLAQMHAYL